jgi:hypothetical protein
MKKVREFLINQNKHYLGDDNIIYVSAVGEQTDESAMAQKEVELCLLDLAKDNVCYLIDINQAGKNSPKARRTWRELIDHDKVNKIALVGLHPVARVLAAFVMGVVSKKEMRFFKTKEEALNWLRECKNNEIEK